jgi:hypothetical protein
MAMKDFHPARNPAAGTVPHGDTGGKADQPSSGPAERERQPIPSSTTGNAALDTDADHADHAEREYEALYPGKGKRIHKSAK